MIPERWETTSWAPSATRWPQVWGFDGNFGACTTCRGNAVCASRFASASVLEGLRLSRACADSNEERGRAMWRRTFLPISCSVELITKPGRGPVEVTELLQDWGLGGGMMSCGESRSLCRSCFGAVDGPERETARFSAFGVEITEVRIRAGRGTAFCGFSSGT